MSNEASKGSSDVENNIAGVENDIAEVLGYLFTEWDCPYCDEGNRSEGGLAGGDEVECSSCDERVILLSVR